jgi:translation initiation factor IF-3
MVLVNNEITFDHVKVIDDQETYLGEFNLLVALEKAKNQNKDLICINEKSNPPLCKIQNFGKYQYNLKKQTKKQKAPELKEIKIRPNTDTHDLGIKAKRVNEFLSQKNRVKITMVLIGRENNNIDFAQETFNKFMTMINNYEIDIPFAKTNNQMYIQIKGDKQ